MLIHSPTELATLVKAHRQKLKMSQAEISDLVGLRQQTLSEFEINPQSTQLDTLFRILSALQLDIKIVAKNEKSAAVAQWKEEW